MFLLFTYSDIPIYLINNVIYLDNLCFIIIINFMIMVFSHMQYTGAGG